MNLTGTPDFSINESDGTILLHVNFVSDDGSITYDRWVNQDDWNADQGQTVTADVAAFLANRPAALVMTPVNDPPATAPIPAPSPLPPTPAPGRV